MKKLFARIKTAIDNYERDPLKRNIDALQAKVEDGTITDSQRQMLADMRGGGPGAGSVAVDPVAEWKNRGY